MTRNQRIVCGCHRERCGTCRQSKRERAVQRRTWRREKATRRALGG